MSFPDRTQAEIPDTVTVDGAAADDAVFLLELIEDFLLRAEDADALVAHYGHPTTAVSLADWAAGTAAHLRRCLLGVPR